MARKNIFANVMKDEKGPAAAPVVEYAAKGASRSILDSLDDLATKADLLTSGETIVEIDPDQIDPSFIRDRRNEDEEEFRILLEAIRDHGQDSPILVRPHPEKSGRYMVVFGHRRLRAARELGRKVRAVIKEMEERQHVLALAQENSVRANIPFVERARFAAEIASRRYDSNHETIMKALSIDRSTLSKMLAIASMPEDILETLGAARSIGRDRWYELKLLLDHADLLEVAYGVIAEEEYARLDGDARFERLLTAVKSASRQVRSRKRAEKKAWSPSDGTVNAEIVMSDRSFRLAVSSRSQDAGRFGEFLIERLDQMYEEYRKEGKLNGGN